MLTRAQAVAQGFTIDNSASGRPVAYKGPRFRPTEWHWMLTDHETTLMEILEDGLRLFSSHHLLANSPACLDWTNTCRSAIHQLRGKA